MISPQVHVPYHKIEEYLGFIRDNRINLEIYFSSHALDSIRDSDIANLREKLEYDPLFTVHAPFMDLSPGAVDSKVREITLGRFQQVFDIAGILQAGAIVFHSGYEKWKYALRVDVWLENSLETWRPLSKRAGDTGIKIAIENIFEDDPVNLRLLMEEMGSDSFGLCFDAGHFNLFSIIPLDAWLEQLKPYIIELHLHDNMKTFDDHKAIGDGTFDFKTLFSALKGRDLIYTIEGHTPEDVIKSVEELRKYSTMYPSGS